jgi:hypothetical protein
LIGPHYVVKGKEKNYVQFMNYNLEKKLNNVYFEDTIAKAILFRTAEKIYGIKPNAIGDMRSMAVPYSISLFNYLTKNQLDLYKIWKAQELSEPLKSLLHEIMSAVESFIKKVGPGGRYEEYAKKEDCWIQVKNNDFGFDLSTIKNDLIDKKNPPKRIIISDDETINEQIKDENLKIKSIPYSVWKKIDNWGIETEELTANQLNILESISYRVRTDSKLLENERITGIKILDTVITKAPELLFEIDELNEQQKQEKNNLPEIDLDLIKKMVAWDRKNKRLKDYQFTMMWDIAEGKEVLTENKKKYCLYNFQFISKYGFTI